MSRYRRVTVLRPSNYWRNWITTKVRSRTWIAVCESLPRVPPAAESEARALLATMPGMGPVTIDSVLCELGDVRRFRSQRQVVAYAGLALAFAKALGGQSSKASPKKVHAYCVGR